MADIFGTEKSVFFVGGTGTKAGNANAGGCTKAWYDANFTTVTDIMGSNGAPLVAATSCTYTHSSKRISKAGAFTNAEAGMVAYLAGTNITTGRYKITAKVDNDTVEVSGIVATGDNTDTTINIGGAFDTLQNACDNTDASSFDVTIHTNKDETLSATLDIDTDGGSIADNSRKYILGFYQTPGDQDRGGAYYRDATHGWVGFDGNDMADELIEIGLGLDNISLRNLYLHNIDTVTVHSLLKVFYSGTFPENIHVKNCKFDDGYRGIYTYARNMLIEDCIFNSLISNYQVHFKCYNGQLLNCEFNTASGKTAIFTDLGELIAGCIFKGGSRAIQVDRYNCLALNNMFYGQTSACIYLDDNEASLTDFNNIFDPAAVDDYAVQVANGTVLSSDYSCAYCTAATSVLDAGHAWPEKGPHSIEVDPEFVSAGGGDFRPRNPEVLRGGKPDIEGHATAMGPVLQKYQFIKRARPVNLGRLQLVR